MTNSESLTNSKIIITKCDRYYRVRQNLLQGVTVITKCERRLLQSVTGITKRANYDKMRRNNILNYFRVVP